MRTRSAVIGYGLLTVFLTAGAAQGLSGSNTVFTDDIVDAAVTTPDIRDDAITSNKIKTGAIFGSDIQDGAVTGTDVGNQSLSVSDYARSAGQANNVNFGAVAAGGCLGINVEVGFDPAGLVITLTPPATFDDNGDLVVTAQDSVANAFEIQACNTTDGAIDPPSVNFPWVMVDPTP